EVYFPNQGWITFDPTPGSNRINTDSGHITAIMAYIDYLKFRWQRYVIDFSRNDQSRMFSSARQKISWNKNKVFNKIGKGNKNNKNLVVFIAVISALIIIIYSSGWFN
ncbi:MAG: hypothetical protein GTN99_11775, partial [Candidatus Dadabacteria bacterium]|nr:hypothetical protein [Candidatus Dadabacteria bacterium]NIT14877.1 hypothetical protein [Candidatus Dadabacteria bacterium]